MTNFASGCFAADAERQGRSTGAVVDAAPALFLLLGGNEVWTFLELAKHLDALQPVYGILPAAGRGSAPPTA